MALGAGICSAIAMFSIVFGSVLALPLFYLAPLPLYLAGLGIGSKGVVIAVFAAVVTAGLIGGVYTALPFAFAYGLPVVLICRQALRTFPDPNGKPAWYPVGDIVSTLCVIGVAILIFVAILTMMDENVGSMSEAVAGFLAEALDKMVVNLSADARDALVGSLAPYFPGMAVASWILMHIVNAMAGQSALVKSGRNLRPKVAYIDMTLPDWFSWVLVGAGIMALALPGDWSYVGYNLVIVTLVPFFLIGLAVVHSLARKIANGTLLLVAFYVFLMVLGWAAFLVAGIGVIEQWIGLRKRVQAITDQESE